MLSKSLLIFTIVPYFDDLANVSAIFFVNDISIWGPNKKFEVYDKTKDFSLKKSKSMSLFTSTDAL